MKNKLIYFTIFQGVFLAWCFTIHHYFFETTNADYVAMAIAAIIPLIVLRTNHQVSSFMAILVSLPLFLFPLINSLREFLHTTWILIYIFLFLAGLGSLSKSRYRFIGLVSIVLVWILPNQKFNNQRKYYDKLISSKETRKGHVDQVSWKNDRWIYYNGSLSISTADGHMLAETLTHTTIPFYVNPKILLLGGDHGLTGHEIKKYPLNFVQIPYDAAFAEVDSPGSISSFFQANTRKFDVIIIDLPDPENLEFEQFYKRAFYLKLTSILSENGSFITNGGSVHSGSKRNAQIKNIIQDLELNTTELQAQIPTLGHRSWIIGSKKELDFENLKIPVKTKWINKEAIRMMLSKGKSDYPF